MVTYHIRMRKFKVDVDVPNDVRGLDNVMHYILDEMATDYANNYAKVRQGLVPPENLEEYKKGLYNSYYKSHKPSIMAFLQDLAIKLGGRVDIWAGLRYIVF